jgi:hypothetical protein
MQRDVLTELEDTAGRVLEPVIIRLLCAFLALLNELREFIVVELVSVFIPS